MARMMARRVENGPAVLPQVHACSETAAATIEAEMAGGTAVVWERWYKVRTTIISKVAPGGAMEQLMTYDFSDGYNHPGSPLLEDALC